jgi:RsiW-degrading membrane proteinase PrsW (M82 family)
MSILSFFLSILPGVLIILFIYWKDKHEREPKRYIFICVLLGMLSCIPAIFGTLGFEMLFNIKNGNSSPNIGVVAVYAFVAVGLSEEFGKFLFLRFYMYRKAEFDEPMDGIVYAVCIGMGFAILENILYVYYQDPGGIRLALLRMFTAVPGHAAFGVIMGYYVGLAKFEKIKSKRTFLLIIGVTAAAAIHGAYDFFLFQQAMKSLALLAFVVLIAGIYMSSKLIKKHIDNSPHNENFKGNDHNQQENDLSEDIIDK